MNVRPATENDNANCSVSLSKNALPHEIQDRLVASKSMDSTVRANCTLAHSPKAKRIVLGNHNRVKLIMEAMKFIYREPECFLFSRVLPSRVFNGLVSWLTGVRLHDHNCGFKCYRREIFNEVRLYGELHRFVPVLAAARGWKVGELVVHHRARKFGHSKYGVKRFAKGFLDLLTVYFLTGFGQRPQHLLGFWGLFHFLVGGLGVAALAVWWIVSRVAPGMEAVHLTERVLFYITLGALFLGVQFLSLGILAELITAYHMRDARVFSIRQTTSDEASADHEPDH